MEIILKSNALLPRSAVVAGGLRAAVEKNRSSKTEKLFVFLPEFPDFFFNGPYASAAETAQCFARAAALRAWGAPNAAFPAGVAEFASHTPNDNRACVAVAFDSFPWKLPGAALRATAENPPGRVSAPATEDADPAVRPLDVLLPWRADLLTPDLLTTLSMLYVLGADVGLANVMVAGDRVLVADYERSAKSDARFYVSKRLTKKSGAAGVFAKFYPEVAEKIRSLDLDLVPPELDEARPALEERRATLIELFESGSTTPLPTRRLARQLALRPLPSGSDENAPRNASCQPNKQRTLAPKKAPKRGARSKRENETNPEGEGRQAKRRPKGLRPSEVRGASRQGLKLSIVASALRYYILAGNVEQALACAFELKCYGHTRAKIIRNICCDVSPLDLSIAGAVCFWVDGWAGNNPAELAAAVEMLARAPKSRIVELYWDTFTDADEYARYRESRPDLKLPLLEHALECALSAPLPESTPGFLLPSDRTQAGGRLFAAAVEIHARLASRDPLAIIWINAFRESFCSVKVERRRGRTCSDVILWEIIAQFIAEEYVEIFARSYFLAIKNPILTLPAAHILMLPVAHILLGGGGESRLIDRQIALGESASEWTSNPALELLESGKVPITLEDSFADYLLAKEEKARRFVRGPLFDSSPAVQPDSDSD